ncbi:homoserine kinase [Brevibacterium ihuae]|uniref:homoserine kinase n=1 Tax=Brevibacterium ihuae TaxID=1631743 RepID=UPI000C75D2AF|nr:homoserine kinase [Brevibacterium ihuae]
MPTGTPVDRTVSDTVAPAGLDVLVEVPATSANLGAGYDSFGMALDIRDAVRARVSAEAVDPAACVTVIGEGADDLPRDASHLAHRVASEILAARGIDLAGRLSLECRNVIPQSRGMGSSASAVVAGIAVADALARAAGLPGETAANRLAWATRYEGHPDNAAPALFGGVSISFTDLGGAARSVSLPVADDVRVVLVVPDTRLDTAVARALLPEVVPHAEAAANSAVAGLFVHAISTDPSLLLEATVDRLHQNYRRPAMSASLERIDALRAAGLAAVVSGAGPTIAVLGTGADLGARVRAELGGDDARIIDTRIAPMGAVTTVDGAV